MFRILSGFDISQGDNLSHINFRDSFPVFTKEHHLSIVATDQETSNLPDLLQGSQGFEVYTIYFRLHKKKLMSFTYNMNITTTNDNTDLQFDLGPHGPSLKIERVSKSKV